VTETSQTSSTSSPGSYPALRARAIESLLIEKGYLTEEAVDYVVSAYEQDIGPMRGARLVARAWVDPAFKERLLANASEAARELGISGFVGENVMAVENTNEVHNVVACKLCSCYPWAILGLPPSWYKSPEYRSRIVREPRSVLREFGLEPDEGAEILVWDSSSDMRYFVVPPRPAGTDELSEEELAALVTRDSMIGTGRPKSPGS
jgi:nitrile hydratase